MPVGQAGLGIGVEGVNAVMLGGDEEYIVNPAADTHSLEP